VELATPFPRMTYQEALERYGTDKPDLRFDMQIQDVTEILKDSDFRLFQEVRGTGASIRGIRAVGAGNTLSRKELDELAGIAKAAGANGALWVRLGDEGLSGQFARALDPERAGRFIAATGLERGDLFVVVIGRFRTKSLVPESQLATTDAERLG